jgi:AraC family transcriptional regulator
MHNLRLGNYAAGSEMVPHSHVESSFTIVLHGSYNERIVGRNVEHRPGSMLFYPSGEMHSQQFGRDGALKLIFRPDTSCLTFLTDEKVRLPQAPYVDSMLIREMANRVAKEMRDGDSFSPMVIEGSVLELVATFGRICETKPRKQAIPSWLKEIREVLESQAGDGVTHETLALQVHKHPVHLAKAFRKAYGETIGEYQRRLRLSKAELLLRKRDVALTEIALQSGFSSQSHFSRCFKCAFGTTPSRYRAERL